MSKRVNLIVLSTKTASIGKGPTMINLSKRLPFRGVEKQLTVAYSSAPQEQHGTRPNFLKTPTLIWSIFR